MSDGEPTEVRLLDGRGLAYLDTIEAMTAEQHDELTGIIQQAVEEFLVKHGLKSAVTNEEYARTL
jgi:hypothetical protein